MKLDGIPTTVSRAQGFGVRIRWLLNSRDPTLGVKQGILAKQRSCSVGILATGLEWLVIPNPVLT